MRGLRRVGEPHGSDPDVCQPRRRDRVGKISGQDDFDPELSQQFLPAGKGEGASECGSDVLPGGEYDNTAGSG